MGRERRLGGRQRWAWSEHRDLHILGKELDECYLSAVAYCQKCLTFTLS